MIRINIQSNSCPHQPSQLGTSMLIHRSHFGPTQTHNCCCQLTYVFRLYNAQFILDSQLINGSNPGRSIQLKFDLYLHPNQMTTVSGKKKQRLINRNQQGLTKKNANPQKTHMYTGIGKDVIGGILCGDILPVNSFHSQSNSGPNTGEIESFLDQITNPFVFLVWNGIQ